MKSLPEIFNLLKENSLFNDWIKSNSKAYLSHFFCSVDSNLELKGSWEIGYYHPETEKITTFVQIKEDQFEIKPADEVFKKDETKVEELNSEEIKIDFAQAKNIFQENLSKLFPQQELGDGFIVVQKLNQKTLWNFTLITKRIQFLNIKISVEDGKVESHELIDLVQKS